MFQDLQKELNEANDMNRKYLNTIDWMEKKIAKLEADLIHAKAKAPESDSSNARCSN